LEDLAVTGDEIAARLKGGGIKLAFDTNALWDTRRHIKLCSAVQRLNVELHHRARLPVALIVCTIAHAEKLMDLKQLWRERFDRREILRGLERKGLHIQPFEAEHAMETGDRLGERYPDGEAWRTAKKRRYMEALGMSPIRDSDRVSGSGASCDATIDWLIVGHARAEGCVLVTRDGGDEFKGFVDRVRIETLQAAIEQIQWEPE
jgi:hypothetical protein